MVEPATLFQNHGAFNRVAQLADISQPVMGKQRRLSLGSETLDIAFKLAVVVLDEVLGERQDVLAVLAKRGMRIWITLRR